jgi:hypothetical protein
MVDSKHYTKKMYEKDKILVGDTEDTMINPENIFDSVELKREILESYGYRVDRRGDNEVGAMFSNVYDTAVRNSYNLEGLMKFIDDFALALRMEQEKQPQQDELFKLERAVSPKGHWGSDGYM